MAATIPTASFPHSEDIIIRWRMEEESGNRIDSVGSCDLQEYLETLYGNAECKEGIRSVGLEEAKKSLKAINDDALIFTTEDFSFMFSIWLAAGDWGWVEQLIPIDVERLYWFVRAGKSGNTLRIELYTRDVVTGNHYLYWQTAWAADPFPTEQWHNIILTRTGTTGKIFYNFEEKTPIGDCAEDIIGAFRGGTTVGGGYGGGVIRDHLLDDFVIWQNYGLVADDVTEIEQLYEFEEKFGTAQVSGNGDISLIGLKQAISSPILISDNGLIEALGIKKASLDVVISDNGSLIISGFKKAFSPILVSGNGDIQVIPKIIFIIEILNLNSFITKLLNLDSKITNLIDKESNIDG